MVRMRCWWCGVTVALGLALGCARQAVPEYPALASTERHASSGQAPVKVLSLRHEFVFDDKGNWQQTTEQTYRVVNRAGVDSWGAVGASWSPWYMAKPELSAQVKDPGGALRQLDPKVIAESSAYPDVPDVYGDQRILRAPLPGVQIGSEISEKIVRKTTRPFFVGGSSFQISFQTAIPRDKVELVVDLPEKLPFQYELRDIKVKQEETRKAGRRRVSFRAEHLGGIEPNDGYTPGNVAEWPSVAFSTGGSWRQIAAAYETLMEEKLKGAAGVAELARKSVKADATPIEKANQLLYALHERVRYASVAFGEAAIIPATPAETLTRTYGDCKDQSLVLVSMLRAVGLPATLALLRAGPGEDVVPRLPSLDAFDHAIVVVQGDAPFWIDPTSDVARAGELPAGDQGRLALIIDDDTDALTPIPSMSAAQNTYFETRDVRLTDEGPALISEVSTSTGLVEQSVRQSFAPSPEERKEGLEAYVKDIYGADKLVSSRFDALEDVRQPFKLSLEASSDSFGASDLYTANVPLNHSVVYSYLPSPLLNRSADDTPRKTDLLLAMRYQAELRYRIVPPPHYRAKRLPQPKPVEMGPLKLVREMHVAKDGAVEATFKLSIDKQRLSPAEQSAIREGLNAIDAEPGDVIELEHDSVAAFETGKNAEGMRLLLAESAAQPKASAPLVRLALKLDELGFGQVARDKLRAGAANAPKDAMLQRSLGFVLTRDPFGRWMHEGHERSQAIVAHRRALEIEPDTTFSKTELAVLLEYDDKGKRYASQTDTEEAIKIYDSIPDETLKNYENGAFRWNALHALIGLERWDEVGRRLEKLGEEAPAFFHIAYATAERGPAAGIAEADKRNLRGEARADALATAAGFLYLQRRYPDAVGLFDEAAKSTTLSESRYGSRARLLRQLARVEPAQLKQDSPEAVARKAHAFALSKDAANAKSLWSSRASAELTSFNASIMAGLAAGLSGDVPQAVIVDVGVGMVKVSTEGSDATGHRVSMKTTGFEGFSGTEVAYYVVKDGGGYTVRATGFDYDAIGCEALHQAQKHNDKAARQWLTWAASDMGNRGNDDPLGKTAFVRAWGEGKAKTEVLAALLCAGGQSGKEARQSLVKLRGSSQLDPSILEEALGDTASLDKNYELQLTAAEQLLRLHPTSERARRMKLDALRGLKRWDVLEQALRDGLKGDVASTDARSQMLFDLADLQTKRGKLVESRKTLQQVIDDTKLAAREAAYNNAAWAGLFLEPRPKEMLEQAQQAVQLGRSDFSSMHTLACIYLDQGNISEAQKTFDRLLEIDQKPELLDATRYVMGGLAEAYGLMDEARRAYQSVRPPEEPSPTATYLLAQKRLKALDATSRKK